MQDQEKYSKEISFGKIIRLLLMQSKLILGFTLLGLTLGIVSYVTSEKTYRVTSMMQIYQADNRSFSNNMFDNFLNSSSTSDVRFVQDLYIARSNLLPIIEKFNLNLRVEGLETDEKIIFNEFKYDANTRQSKNFKIKLDKDLFYLSSSFTNDIFIELPYDQQNTIDNFVLNIKYY